MNTLATTILEHTEGLPEGAPISAKELLHFGSRAAVDQALSRLVKRGQLMRVSRGVYVRPVVCDAAAHLTDLVFPAAEPRILRVERTFWEKATAVHVFCLHVTCQRAPRAANHAALRTVRPAWAGSRAPEAA